MRLDSEIWLGHKIVGCFMRSVSELSFVPTWIGRGSWGEIPFYWKKKKKRTIEFWFREILLRKLDQSLLNELSDVYILSLEDGRMIRGIFTVGRRVEDCVYFLFLLSPVHEPLSHLCGVKLCCQYSWGSPCPEASRFSILIPSPHLRISPYISTSYLTPHISFSN